MKPMEEATWFSSIIIVPKIMESCTFVLIIGCSMQPPKTRWQGKHGSQQWQESIQTKQM